jgi:hypothetical protein
MTTSIYLFGEPGIGKSTVLKIMTNNLTLDPPAPAEPNTPLLKTQRFPNGIILGYDDGSTFTGTDRLSMGVQPDAIKWVTTAPLPDTILGEGQRLANIAFLTELAQRTNLTPVHIKANPELAQQRRNDRGTGQKESWAKGARTRAYNLETNLNNLGIPVLEIPATLNPYDIADIITQHTGWNIKQ